MFNIKEWITAREQSDPVFTKQGFSHCTFCFQNTQDHSKFSSWGKDATSGRRGDNRNLSQRSWKAFQGKAKQMSGLRGVSVDGELTCPRDVWGHVRAELP